MKLDTILHIPIDQRHQLRINYAFLENIVFHNVFFVLNYDYSYIYPEIVTITLVFALCLLFCQRISYF